MYFEKYSLMRLIWLLMLSREPSLKDYKLALRDRELPAIVVAMLRFTSNRKSKILIRRCRYVNGVVYFSGIICKIALWLTLLDGPDLIST